jgi:hypothetical protein
MENLRAGLGENLNLLWQGVGQIGFDALHHLTWAGIRAPRFLEHSKQASALTA